MKANSQSRRKLGLALSGGGARGLAHIGIQKVFEEAGITVDFVAGTSMGAIIGACIAKSIPALELENIAIRFSSTRQLIRMVDLSGGRRGLLAGNHVRNFLADVLGAETTFDQLHIPLAICTVDLEDGTEKAFTQGNLLDAVMASIAVPGVFKPQVVNERELVDGGVKNNLPVDHVRELGAEFVIAVDVMRHDFTKLGAGSRSEHFLITPTASFQDIYRYIAMMISEQTRLRLLLDTPDILIQPELPDDLFAFGGFSRASEAIATGELAARKVLPEIIEMLKPAG